jgi:serine/threonine-protein kinase
MNPADQPSDDLAAVPESEVREQLQRILASPLFRNSARLQRFLQLAVERTLAGKLDELKEYALGRDAFDRGAEYDPRTDSIVRVEAQRLRGKLRDYYGSLGRTESVVITLNPGSYVPVFSRAAPLPEARAAEPLRPDPNTVAVLPFTNLSPEPEQDYFCDGIAEDIINELITIRGLNVVGRTSTFAFKGSTLDLREIGSRLGAGTVIEGSVRKAGDVLRVSAKIVDAASGRALWSEIFDRPTGDVFSIEDEIAGAIAATLRVTLAAKHTAQRRGIPNFEAHSLYLKGRHAWNRLTQAGYLEAIAHYSRAISLFPDYALPYSGLADALSWIALWGVRRPHEVLPRARRAALEALRLDPQLAHAYTSLGIARSLYDWEWNEGTALLRKGIELEPSYALGHQFLGWSLAVQGDFEESLESCRRAVFLDPLSVRTNRVVGYVHYCGRGPEEAEKFLRQSLALDPASAVSRFLLAELFLEQHRDHEALEVAEELATATEDPFAMSVLAAAHARNGHATASRRIMDRLVEMSTETYVDAFPVAVSLAAMGDDDRALAWLERCCAERSPTAACLNIDPIFDDVRTSSRFQALLAQMHLDPAPTAG